METPSFGPYIYDFGVGVGVAHTTPIVSGLVNSRFA
jgi:hypothetical protein